jgi:ketosteroid isomerase-like protein
MSELRNLEVVRRLVECWNAGDTDGVLALCQDDVVQESGPDWPEQGEWRGKSGMREGIEQWRSAWETVEIELESLEGFGDRVVAHGTWSLRGLASGVGGTWPASAVVTLRDGKVQILQWFADHDGAVAAARQA